MHCVVYRRIGVLFGEHDFVSDDIFVGFDQHLALARSDHSQQRVFLSSTIRALVRECSRQYVDQITVGDLDRFDLRFVTIVGLGLLCQCISLLGRHPLKSCEVIIYQLVDMEHSDSYCSTDTSNS